MAQNLQAEQVLHEYKISVPVTVNKPYFLIWVQSICNRYIKWRKEAVGPFFFQTKTVEGESYKNTLPYYAFPGLREYSEERIFKQTAASHYAVLVR